MVGDRRRLRGAEGRLLKGYSLSWSWWLRSWPWSRSCPARPRRPGVMGQRRGDRRSNRAAGLGVGDTVRPAPIVSCRCPTSGTRRRVSPSPTTTGARPTAASPRDTIGVTYRVTSDPNLFLLLGQLGGVPLDETNDEMSRTTEALVEYFNANFELYGRRIELVPYEGGADPPRVHRGRAGRRHQRQHQGGQRDRRLRRHHRHHPAVRRRSRAQRGRGGGRPTCRGVVRGAPPLPGALSPDCTITAEGSAIYANGRLFGRTADHAGGDLALRNARWR